MLLIRTMTRWCYTVCVAGIALAAGLSIFAVWTETGEAVLWQGLSSIAIVMAASFSTLLVTNAFWSHEKLDRPTASTINPRR